MAREARWSEGRIDKLTWRLSFRIEGDLEIAQHTVHERLRVGEYGVPGLPDPVRVLVSQLDKLAAEFHQMMTARPGGRLEELIEICQPVEDTVTGRQYCCFIGNRKTGEWNLRSVGTKSFSDPGHPAIYDARFRRETWRPGAGEIPSDVLVRAGLGHVQLARIGLRHGCEHVLVFYGVADKSLRLGVDHPIHSSGRENRILRRTRTDILWANLRGKGKGGNVDKSCLRC